MIGLTANAAWDRSTGSWPGLLAIEMMAQAAAVVLPREEAEGNSAWLAGIDSAEFHGPLRAGMRLLAEARLVGRFGRMIKAEASLTSETSGERVATANLLLAMAD